MSRLDTNLALWTETYAKLQHAQAKLAAARATPIADTCEIERLAAEVQQLDRESDAAICDVQVAFATMKKETSKHR